MDGILSKRSLMCAGGVSIIHAYVVDPKVYGYDMDAGGRNLYIAGEAFAAELLAESTLNMFGNKLGKSAGIPLASAGLYVALNMVTEYDQKPLVQQLIAQAGSSAVYRQMVLPLVDWEMASSSGQPNYTTRSR